MHTAFLSIKITVQYIRNELPNMLTRASIKILPLPVISPMYQVCRYFQGRWISTIESIILFHGLN